MMNHLQFEYGLIPTKVNKEDKAQYIQALIDSREQDSTEPFREFMLQEHYNNLKQEIDNYRQSQEGGHKTERVYRKGGQKNSVEREQRWPKHLALTVVPSPSI